MRITLRDVHLINKARPDTFSSPDTRDVVRGDVDQNLGRDLCNPRSKSQTRVSSISVTPVALSYFITDMPRGIPHVICIANSEIQMTNLNRLIVEYLEMVARDKSTTLVPLSHSIKDHTYQSITK